VTGDAERTKDTRQTYRKLGSGVLGAWMETHNSLTTSFFTSLLLHASFLYSLKPYLFFYSLKPFFFSIF
jgi:hypothetical protein